MRATLSILGLWKASPNIFAGLNVPAGVNKTHVIDAIVTECAELELLYTDPDYLRYAIGVWSTLSTRDWNKVMEAASAEFNPIHNYDRYEEWTDNGSNTRKSSGDTTESVTGYNTDTMEPRNSNSGTSTDDSSGTSQHSGHLYGNIGVTTAPQMLKEFLDIEPQLNIYRYIAEDFKRRFCLLVY